MASYKGNLRDDLASNNDEAIQALSHQVMLIEDQLLDIEDNKDSESVAMVRQLRKDRSELLSEISDLRRQGR